MEKEWKAQEMWDTMKNKEIYKLRAWMKEKNPTSIT